MLADSALTQLAKLNMEHSSGRTHSWCVGNKLKMITRHAARKVSGVEYPLFFQSDPQLTHLTDQILKEKYVLHHSPHRVSSARLVRNIRHTPPPPWYIHVGMLVLYFIHEPAKNRPLTLAFVFQSVCSVYHIPRQPQRSRPRIPFSPPTLCAYHAQEFSM